MPSLQTEISYKMAEYPTAEWKTPLNLACQRDKHNEDHKSMITSINHCSYEVSKFWTWISQIHQQKVSRVDACEHMRLEI